MVFSKPWKMIKLLVIFIIIKPYECILTHNQFLSNLRAVFCKNWNILQTNKNLLELFQEHPNTAFKRNKNLKEIIGGTRVENGGTKKINFPSRTGKTTPFLFGARTLCWNQKMTKDTFTSLQTKQTFNIFFNLNCKSVCIVHLIEFILCKIQYVGKAETTFKLRFK